MEHVHTAYMHCLNALHFHITGKHPVHHHQSKKDKDSRVDSNAWHALERNFGLNVPEKPDLVVVNWCERPMFESIIGGLVMINAVTMALELDLSAKDAAPDDRVGWIAADLTFCVLFTAEIIFRIYCLGLYTFFSQPRYLADVFLVAFNVADAAVTLSGAESTGLQSFSALRILRLFKIMKLLRLVSHVKELSLIATGLVSALKSLQWVTLLLAVLIFVMSVMFKILMGRECDSADIQVAFSYRFPDIDPVVKCEEFWGTVVRSMYTLYQVTTTESWSEVIVRPIFDARPIYVLIIMAFQLVTTFGLLNIVVAAIVDGTMNSIDEAVVENQNKKHTQAHLKVLKDIFIQATLKVGGDTPMVTKESLLEALLTPATRRKLLLLNIEYDDPAQIWRIVDNDGDGAVDISDFTTNLMRMRGAAKAKDLLAIRSLVYRVDRKIEAMVEEVKGLCKETLAAVVKTDGDVLAGGADSGAAGGPDSKGAPIAVRSEDSTVGSAPGLQRFQEELRGEIGKLAVQFQDQFGNFKQQLSKDISGQLFTLESNMFRLTPTFQQSNLSRSAADLYVQPTSIPREQTLPGLPKLIGCCSVGQGADDRARQVVTRAADVEPDSKLSSLLNVEHTALMKDLEDRHKHLLSRVNVTMPTAAQDQVVARSFEASEPKQDQQKASAPSVQSASTQTSVQDEAPVTTIARMATADMPSTDMGRGGSEEDEYRAGSTIDDAEANRVLEAITKEKRETGGFQQALDNQKEQQKLGLSAMEAFVHGPRFEGFFGMLIMANAMIMAFEVQYTSFRVGFDLKYPGVTKNADDTWPGARAVFDGLELVFGIVFVFELVLKIGVLRLNFLRSTWNWLDSLIVGGWLVDNIFGVSAVLNPMMLRLFRLVKLLRVAKLFKSFQAFDSLSILIGSMKASMSVLFWSIVVLFTAQLAAALLLSQGLESYLSEEAEGKTMQQRHDVYEFFGSFTRSFVTTMQLTLGNWVPVCRLLYENVGAGWAAFIVAYILLIHFAAIKVISAVFLVETQKVASTDEELLILQKERQISRLIKNFAGVFKEIDQTGDGLVDWGEFQSVIHNPRVLTWLAALDLDIEQCEGMFTLLDGGDGKISFQEFVKGVQRLKGDAKAIDLTMLMNRHAELTNLVIKLTRMVETRQGNVG